MQANVFPFIVFDLNRNLRLGLALWDLDLGLDDVVLPARRNALRKLAPWVGHQFPLGFLAGSAADGDRNAGERMFVRPPDGADDQGVVPGGSVLLRAGMGRSERPGNQRATARQQHENKRGPAATMGQATAHATPLPLLPRLPLRRRSRPRQPGSTAAARLPPLRNPCRTPDR